MTKQSSFSDLEYAQKKRLTRREQFLNEMKLASLGQNWLR